MTMNAGLYKMGVFILCCMPAAFWLGHLVFNGHDWGFWGADPAKRLNHELGKWGLYFLFITLAVTPVRELVKWPVLARYRRMLGLFCLFYVALHVLSYLQFLVEWDVNDIVADVIKRPYITFGAVALVGLIALGITSTKSWMKRLKKNWQRLHQGVYGIAILGVLHYVYIQRSDIGEAVLYGMIVALLLGYRVYKYTRRRLFMS